MNNAVEARKSKSCVTLVLTNSVLAEIIRIIMFKVQQKNILREYKNRVLRRLIIYLPAISWKVLVMMKSVWFIAKRSAVNWQEKWYLSSSFFQ